MIVSGGENVFPAEVEELLAGPESIEEAAALGVEDERFGQRLKGFVVLRDGAELSEDESKGYVKENLATYKIPREVAFIDELPRNATGKVLKRELEEGEPESAADGTTETAMRARSPRNRTIKPPNSGSGSNSASSRSKSKPAA